MKLPGLFIRKPAIFLIKRLSRILSASQRAKLIKWIAEDIVEKSFPRDAARFLMELDTGLYHLQGQAALIDNGGIHPKHFLMNYHDFFVSRTNPGERVLDFGCGVGAVAFDLAEKAHAIVDGIDISAENIATARQRFSHERVRYIHGNGLTKSLGETYDVVVLSNVLEHLEDRVPALKSIQRNSGAKRFLIRVPMFERDWRVAYKKYLGVEWRLDEDHKIEFTIEEFRQELNQAGLNITDCEYRWGEIWAEVSVGK